MPESALTEEAAITADRNVLAALAGVRTHLRPWSCWPRDKSALIDGGQWMSPFHPPLKRALPGRSAAGSIPGLPGTSRSQPDAHHGQSDASPAQPDATPALPGAHHDLAGAHHGLADTSPALPDATPPRPAPTTTWPAPTTAWPTPTPARQLFS